MSCFTTRHQDQDADNFAPTASFVKATHDEAVAAALEDAAGFGLWHYDWRTGLVSMTGNAGALLGFSGEVTLRREEACACVAPDDSLRLMEVLAGKLPPEPALLEFRVIDGQSGMRWLRASLLPASATGVVAGVLLDVTERKHAAVRERLGYELTEYLVGSPVLDHAMVNVIQLVCRSLGWEWGAYWAMDPAHPEGPRLVCKHFWHQPDHDVGAFSSASSALSMGPGQGLVGRVWATGQAEWVEDVPDHPTFLRRSSAHDCGLWSGYVFPVTYATDNGDQHRPGVLEFYSTLSRQPDAQLPKLSATIGALIAQTAQRLENEAVIHRLAHIDELTELANRSSFYRQLNRQCDVSARTGHAFGLMFIDLDRFKPINDAFGHDAGNEVLQEFARRLKALAPEGSCVGRLGGDEFAVLLRHRDDAEWARLVALVLAAASQPVHYEGVALTVSASIGVSRFPENGHTGPELLRSADAAMYRVKQNGRSGCDVFSTSDSSSLALQSESLARRLKTETELAQALQDRALHLVYQPIFDTRSGCMHAVEALVRWRRPDGTLVPPDWFIPIAEQSHLIVEMGRWVAAQACEDLVRLHRAGFDGLKLHVNMAASEFTSRELPNRLSRLLQKLGIPPSHVVLELTEGMLMKQPEQVIAVMHQLRAIGVEISLDDFGMGHSSLAMLKNLPIHSMKIDRSFVRDLPDQPRDRAIAQTILDLGRHMKLDVIAEGIETGAQLDILRQAGCHLVQGFLLSKPADIETLLDVFPGGRLQR